MRKIRVLVVDDSVVIRQIVSRVLSEDPAIEIAATAQHGRFALAKIPRVHPDVVTLDLEMPEMDGLQTLAAIRKEYKDLPVIMLSAFTERGAQATLDALFLGATDYVAKPMKLGSAEAALERLRSELIPKIKTFSGRAAVDTVPTPSRPIPVFPSPNLRAPARLSRVDVVAIGGSTGGPNALADILTDLPAAFQVPVVVVQHMPQMFTKILAERMATRCQIRVDEGSAGGALTPGHAWIAPGGHHMTVERNGNSIHVGLNQGPPENSVRPSVDVLFRAVASVYGPRCLGVVLTGMGSDGLDGCRRIKDAGGQVLVQDEASSVVWGMPGFVAKAGLADMVLPLSELSAEIQRRVCIARSIPAREGTKSPEP